MTKDLINFGHTYYFSPPKMLQSKLSHLNFTNKNREQ